MNYRENGQKWRWAKEANVSKSFIYFSFLCITFTFGCIQFDEILTTKGRHTLPLSGAVQNSDNLSVFYNFKFIENRWV